MPNDVKALLFRITQKALAKIQKHAASAIGPFRIATCCATGMTIRPFIIDDHPLVCDGLKVRVTRVSGVYPSCASLPEVRSTS